MMLMSMMMFQVLSSLIPTFTLLVLVMVDVSHTANKSFSFEEVAVHGEVNRFNYFLLGYIWQLLVVSMITTIFWLEDKPVNKLYYLIAFYLAVVLCMIGFLFHLVGVVFWFSSLPLQESFSSWVNDAINAITLCNAMIYLFTMGYGLQRFIHHPEYHVRIGTHRHAWGALLHVVQPIISQYSVEQSIIMLFGSFGQSVINHVVMTMLFEPWVFICMYDLQDALSVYLYCLWYVVLIWEFIVIVRSAKLGLQLPSFTLEIADYIQMMPFECEKLSLVASQVILAIVTIVVLTLSEGVADTWPGIFLVLLSVLRFLLSMGQLWLEFGDTQSIIWNKLVANPLDPDRTSYHNVLTIDPTSVPTFDDLHVDNTCCLSPQCNFWKMREWIKISEREMVRMCRMEDSLQRYPYPLCFRTRKELTLCQQKGRLLQIYGALGIRRLGELIYDDRRMLLVLAFLSEKDGTNTVVASTASFRKSTPGNRFSGANNLVCRIKDHNVYLLRIIASYL